jgi:hypothetical protein
MVVGAPQQLEQVGVLGKWQLRHVAGVQLQHRHQRHRVRVGLRLWVDAFAGAQVDRDGARDDPSALRILLRREVLALAHRSVELTKKLEILWRDRLASIDQAQPTARRPGHVGGPQQGAAQRAGALVWAAGAGVQADRLPRERASSGKTLVTSSGGGGVVRPIVSAWPAHACLPRSNDRQDGSARGRPSENAPIPKCRQMRLPG